MFELIKAKVFVISEILTGKNKTVAIAETRTGGLLSSFLSGPYFAGGLILPDKTAIENSIGVSTIGSHTDLKTADRMCRFISQTIKANYYLAITGIDEVNIVIRGGEYPFLKTMNLTARPNKDVRQEISSIVLTELRIYILLP